MRKIAIYGMIIFQLALIVSLIRNIQMAIKSRSRLTSLEARKSQLSDEENKLKKELEYVRSDEYAEKVAREELQLSKPGETVVIVPEGSIKTQVKQEQNDKLADKPNYQKWWDVVRGAE